jgi:hypothetical protein
MARLICCSAGSANKRSTWLIQDEDVGVKWICQRRALGKPDADEFGPMGRRIVHNDVDVEIGRKVLLDFIK